ncbi:unnamed protein product [Cylindrotheca closterium]|uniref:Uncharacterized protein n=1 Tax=Cylindrotheca closterium TaxID=2856 RepID=A0AAD2CMJ0_9STRA|nr:unnamed protein product [Cylindrotheca closterium]
MGRLFDNISVEVGHQSLGQKWVPLSAAASSTLSFSCSSLSCSSSMIVSAPSSSSVASSSSPSLPISSSLSDGSAAACWLAAGWFAGRKNDRSERLPAAAASSSLLFFSP